MEIKFLIDEDIVNYKKISMVVGMPKCDGKCWKDLNDKGGNYDWTLCQNHSIQQEKSTYISIDDLSRRYKSNPLTKAIVFAGMEPLLSKRDIIDFITWLRNVELCGDDIVIYTGYKEDEKEAQEFLKDLKTCGAFNIIIKYGRYVPDQDPHVDQVLGVKLASDNQYAKRVC